MIEINEQRVERWRVGLTAARDEIMSRPLPEGEMGNALARAAIDLADREAAERVAGDLWAEYERLRNAYGEAEYNSCGAQFAEFEGDGSEKEADTARSALDAFVRRHIALAEAGGEVPAGLQSANESPVSRAMISARQGLCMCGACVETRGEMQVTMHVCPACGNKRCPKAKDHRFRCSGSNAVGQTGELEDATPPRPPAVGSEQ